MTTTSAVKAFAYLEKIAKHKRVHKSDLARAIKKIGNIQADIFNLTENDIESAIERLCLSAKKLHKQKSKIKNQKFSNLRAIAHGLLNVLETRKLHFEEDLHAFHDRRDFQLRGAGYPRYNELILDTQQETLISREAENSEIDLNSEWVSYKNETNNELSTLQKSIDAETHLIGRLNAVVNDEIDHIGMIDDRSQVQNQE